MRTDATVVRGLFLECMLSQAATGIAELDPAVGDFRSTPIRLAFKEAWRLGRDPFLISHGPPIG